MLSFFFSDIIELNMFYYTPISIVLASFFLLSVYLYYTYINNLEQRNIVASLSVFGILVLFVIIYYSFSLLNNIDLFDIESVIIFFMLSNTYSNLLFSLNWYIYLISILVIFLVAIVLLFSFFYFNYEKFYVGEYIVLIFLALFGMLLLLYSNDFITMYLALELQSLSLYVLASIKRNKILSLEAGLKYFATGSFSSGLLVFGISLLYGLFGSTNYGDLMFILSSFPLDYGIF